MISPLPTGEKWGYLKQKMTRMTRDQAMKMMGMVNLQRARKRVERLQIPDLKSSKTFSIAFKDAF